MKMKFECVLTHHLPSYTSPLGYALNIPARIIQGSILKKIVEAIRELVSDANLDCSEEQGISMQVCGFLIEIYLLIAGLSALLVLRCFITLYPLMVATTILVFKRGDDETN